MSDPAALASPAITSGARVLIWEDGVPALGVVDGVSGDSCAVRTQDGVVNLPVDAVQLVESSDTLAPMSADVAVYPTAALRELIAETADRPPVERLRELEVLREDLRDLDGEIQLALYQTQEALEEEGLRGDLALVRENADLRAELLRRRLATPEQIDAMGFVSHEEIAEAEDGGTLRESLGAWLERLHPRGRGGEFAAKPGVPSTAHTVPHPAPAPAAPAARSAWPPTRSARVHALLSEFPDTQSMHSVVHAESGQRVYSPQRQRVHDAILNEMFKGKSPAQDRKHVAVFLAGGTASGKSGVVKAKDPELKRAANLPENAVHIDADHIKSQLPEYQKLEGDPYAAFASHEESSDIAARALKRALGGRHDVVIDGTGDSDAAKFRGKIAAAKATGAEVRVLKVDAPVEDAIARENKRAARTGRHVPEPVVRQTHRQVAVNYQDWRTDPNIDHFAVYSNAGQTPVRVAEGGGGQYRVLHPGEHQRIEAKARVVAP